MALKELQGKIALQLMGVQCDVIQFSQHRDGFIALQLVIGDVEAPEDCRGISFVLMDRKSFIDTFGSIIGILQEQNTIN